MEFVRGFSDMQPAVSHRYSFHMSEHTALKNTVL